VVVAVKAVVVAAGWCTPSSRRFISPSAHLAYRDRTAAPAVGDTSHRPHCSRARC